MFTRQVKKVKKNMMTCYCTWRTNPCFFSTKHPATFFDSNSGVINRGVLSHALLKILHKNQPGSQVHFKLRDSWMTFLSTKNQQTGTINQNIDPKNPKISFPNQPDIGNIFEAKFHPRCSIETNITLHQTALRQLFE